MVDLVAIVKIIPFNHQSHLNVTVSMSTDVEVAWHSIDLEVALQLTALFVVKFSFDTFI